MSILVFGYEPFLEFDENPSQLVAEKLDGRKIGEFNVESRILPVEYGKVEKEITDSIGKLKPDLVIGLGLAVGRSKITPEKIAVNYKHSESPDNAGVKVSGEKIDPSQPDGLFSTLPVEQISEEINKAGIPSSISLSAGGYLCNYAMFVIVRESIKQGFKGGFIHIPCHEGLMSKNPGKNYPSMNLERIYNGIELAIKISLKS